MTRIEWKNGLIASLHKDGTWHSSLKTIERMLNTMFVPEMGFMYDPDIIFHTAERAAEALKAKVVEFDPTDYKKGRVY